MSNELFIQNGFDILVYEKHGNPVVDSNLLELDLFNEVKDEMKNDIEILKENSRICDIRSILALIYNTFKNRISSMNCFFTTGDAQNRICFNYLHSLPIIRFSLLKDSSSNVMFHSDWEGDIRLYEGWESIPDNEMSYKKNSYKAKSVFLLKDIEEINVYIWGFEILSKNQMQMFGILDYAVSENPTSFVGKEGWFIPLNVEALKNVDYMKKISFWNKEQ